ASTLAALRAASAVLTRVTSASVGFSLERVVDGFDWAGWPWSGATGVPCCAQAGRSAIQHTENTKIQNASRRMPHILSYARGARQGGECGPVCPGSGVSLV